MLRSDTAQELTELHDTVSALPLRTLIYALIMLVAGILVIHVLIGLAGRMLKKTRLDSSLHTFFRSILRFVLYFVLILMLAGYLGIDVTSLVALLSVVSLAISLSVQGVLSNVAGGAMVMASKPFRQGDYVSVDGLEGTVDEIGLIYTRLHTMDNRSVLIPNSKVSGATVENFSILGKRRLELVLGASYDSEPDTVMAALRKAVDRCQPLEGEPVIVEFQEFGDSAISYDVCFWIPASRFIQTRYDLRRWVWEEFRAAGVEMTYPHLNVHLDRAQAGPEQKDLK